MQEIFIGTCLKRTKERGERGAGGSMKTRCAICFGLDNCSIAELRTSHTRRGQGEVYLQCCLFCRELGWNKMRPLVNCRAFCDSSRCTGLIIILSGQQCWSVKYCEYVVKSLRCIGLIIILGGQYCWSGQCIFVSCCK